MPRVLAFDAGMNLGFGALGGGQTPVSGCRRLPGGPRDMGTTGLECAKHTRALIALLKPDVVGCASPFIGKTRGKPKTFIKGKPVWGSGDAPIPPDNIRPLLGCLTVIEMVVKEINEARAPEDQIRCIEIDEQTARRAFLTTVPRGSKAQKKAVERGCRQRGWPCSTDHAADALCVASYILECVDRPESHRTTPLFATQ